jgi:hypothetical protein
MGNWVYYRYSWLHHDQQANTVIEICNYEIARVLKERFCREDHRSAGDSTYFGLEEKAA